MDKWHKGTPYIQFTTESKHQKIAELFACHFMKKSDLTRSWPKKIKHGTMTCKASSVVTMNFTPNTHDVPGALVNDGTTCIQPTSKLEVCA